MTSIASLKLRVPPGPDGLIGSAREYGVVHPATGAHLTSIRLNPGFVAQKGMMHDFVVIAYDQGRNAFRLMLVVYDGKIAERINVTVVSRLVRVEDWVALGPWKSTVVMS